MKMTDPAILQQYPTEKYKRFWYPTRPLFTMAQGLFLASLGYLGILPIGWALWLSAAFAFDDLPLTPIMGMITSINNLTHGRKQTKSIVMISAISLAAISGGLLGFFVLSQLPVFMAIITGFIAATSCSPILISIGAITGGLLAHKTNKVSPFTGIMLGVTIASVLPFTVSIMVDTVFICAAGLACMSSILAKQSLQAYYSYRYGHTNADGYQINKPQAEQDEFIKQQARKLGIKEEEFVTLTQHCMQKIHDIKNKATLFEEFSGARQPRTNAYKDIYHGLMSPDLNPSDIASVKELIQKSTIKNIPPRLNDPLIRAQESIKSSETLRTNLQARLFYHQVQISPGIPEKDTQPFLSGLVL